MPVEDSCSPEMKYRRTFSVGTSVVDVLVVGDVLIVLAAAMVVVVVEVLVVGSVSSSPSPA